jgi:hypothetical protein
MHVWFPFSLTQKTLKFKSGWAIWNFSKERGSTELISDYGAQKARLYASGPLGLEPQC